MRYASVLLVIATLACILVWLSEEADQHRSQVQQCMQLTTEFDRSVDVQSDCELKGVKK